MKLYRAKLKSRKRIMAEIPREQQGWWADVCAGQTLILRDATEADVARCSINEGQTRDPADYFCEACERGSLVRRIAVETLTEIADRRAAAVVGDDGLPPPVAPKGPFTDYSAEEVEAYASQYARTAIAADRAARAQQQAQSVDTPEFRNLLGDMLDAYRKELQGGPQLPYEKVRAKFIAYIDGRTAMYRDNGKGGEIDE